jgi:hypothetical protein
MLPSSVFACDQLRDLLGMIFPFHPKRKHFSASPQIRIFLPPHNLSSSLRIGLVGSRVLVVVTQCILAEFVCPIMSG